MQLLEFQPIEYSDSLKAASIAPHTIVVGSTGLLLTRLICLFKAPSMTKKVNNIGMVLFHRLNSIWVICLKNLLPLSQLTRPPRLQAVRTTRKQLYQVLYSLYKFKPIKNATLTQPMICKGSNRCAEQIILKSFHSSFYASTFCIHMHLTGSHCEEAGMIPNIKVPYTLFLKHPYKSKAL